MLRMMDEIRDLVCRVWGSGFRVHNLGFRVRGLGRVAHVKQSRPDFGPCLKIDVLANFQVFLSSFGSEVHTLGRRSA